MPYKDMEKRAQAIQRSNERNRQEYDRFSLMLPKGDKSKLAQIATAEGKSVNKLILDTLQAVYPELQHDS